LHTALEGKKAERYAYIGRGSRRSLASVSGMTARL
jgi:hypothetical protein